MTEEKFKQLQNQFKGDIFRDESMRILYATDASAYRELPLAVVRPKDDADIKTIINFAKQHGTSLIPRTAGTSLAGQVVGKGIVVDVSKYMTQIIELNEEEKWVRVQPGVVLDELNQFLAPKNLFFGPETSTANRCMIGCMVGNNACGAHSLIYGSTRDHTI
ncbi:MAG: FAD-binding oxidoreductase, partial [Bacteroidetes bacterium HGW-Bacteroidetes-17]